MTYCTLSLLGLGLDSCLLPTRFNNYFIAQTVDFFYPLVDDPYMMGKYTYPILLLLNLFFHIS